MDKRIEIIATCDGVIAMRMKLEEAHDGIFDIIEYGNSEIKLYVSSNAQVVWAED